MNIDEPLAMQRGTTTDYFEADGLGSITSMSSSAGALANTYTYDSFGNVTNSTGSVTNFLEYTGREFDTETGLYFYRHREYSPVDGRFVSEDPYRFRADVNFYRYTYNNPVLFKDPFGNIPTTAPLPWYWWIPGVGEGGSVWLGHVLGGGAYVLLRLTVFAPSVARDEDMIRRPPCQTNVNCKEVKARCIEDCSESSLPTRDYGWTFQNCLNRCMEAGGCRQP